MTDRAQLESLLAAGRDDALLRFALGRCYMKSGEFGRAAEEFRRATEMDPDYSAAWKDRGRCLMADGQSEEARRVLLRAREVARRKGDRQAEREAAVFLKRLGE